MSETHKTHTLILPSEHDISFKWALAITLHCLFISTSQPAIKVWVGGHLQAWVWQQEAANVGEARVDVLPHILQLFVLVLFYLCQQREIYINTRYTVKVFACL